MMSVPNPAELLKKLVSYPRETEWLEFKENRFDPEEVGQYLSGLANSAMLHQQEHAYLVFGVQDRTHQVVGTTVRLKAEKVGHELAELWLSRLLHPSIKFEFIGFEYEGRRVEMICIHPAYSTPVMFKTEKYIRIDSALKPLRMYPERERELWQITSRLTFEKGVAAPHVSASELFELFLVEELLKDLGPRQSRAAMIEHLVARQFILDNLQGGYDVTNLFALLCARDISVFPNLAKKLPRIIHYAGTSKSTGVDDVSGRIGYGVSFKRALRYIMERIAHKEEMRHGQRVMVYAIPEIAIREFVVNALIHQDFTIQGSGPVVEIFADRVKVSNPGAPLIDPNRLIDAPPRSRNEGLASAMRELGFCEERGSGVDRAIEAIEREALAPPLMQAVEDSTVVTVFGARSFAKMSAEERVRACYQHASVRWEAGMTMTNQSLRNRFGLSDKQYPQVSLVIRAALEAGQIRPLEADQPNRSAQYIPYWAG